MTICIVSTCDRTIELSKYGHGLCSAHYRRALYGNGDLRSAIRERADSFSPPVCVCDDPSPDAIGECAECLRPYRPALIACRDAWRAYLQQRQP